MTWDGASGAEGRAPPERSPAAPTAPPRPCRTGVEDVPAPGRRGHRAGSASRGCDEGGHAGRCQEGSVLGDKRRGRLEMCPEFVSLCLSGGHRDVRAETRPLPGGRARHWPLLPGGRHAPGSCPLSPGVRRGAGGGGGALAGRAHPGRRSEVPCSTSAVLLRRSASAA